MDEATQIDSVGVYKRPEPWIKINGEAKIERMHEVVKGLQAEIYRLQEEVREAKKLCCEHKHDMQTGEVMVKATPYNNGLSGISGVAKSLSATPEQAYF